MKFILGIANFNSKYGLTNDLKKKDINNIIRSSLRHKIFEIDTANDYKISNKILKNLSSKSNFLINTKIPLIREKNYIKVIDQKISKFKKDIKHTHINTLFFHDRRQIFEKNIEKIINYVIYLKKNKIIKKYGFSVYNIGELEEILLLSNPDVIQVPGNIFDNRFLNNKILNLLKKKKIEIQVRSIFLQGTVLKRTYSLYDKKSEIILNRYWKTMDNFNYDVLDYNINFLKKFIKVDKFILSFDDDKQLSSFFFSIKKKLNKSFRKINFNVDYKKLINPYLWKKK